MMLTGENLSQWTDLVSNLCLMIEAKLKVNFNLEEAMKAREG